MKDLYSIRAFAKISGVDATTLRYWDDIGLFSPVKRNPENNYRYYSLSQLFALNFVTTMSELGFPLKTIAALREERNAEGLLKLFEKREKELDAELHALRMRSSIIHARQELLRYSLRADESQVAILPRDDKEMILWPRNEYREGDTFIEPLAAFIKHAPEHRVHMAFPVGGYWSDMEGFMREPSRPERFFSIDPLGKHIRKKGDYLIGFARGYYAEMGDLPERMAAYIQENGTKVTGSVYAMYLEEEISTRDPSQYLAQICVAVEPE